MNLNHHNCIGYKRYFSPADSLKKKYSLALAKLKNSIISQLNFIMI